MITTSQQTKHKKHSKIPSIIAAVICLIFALWSILWFWSAVLTVRPEKVITQWEEKKENIEPELAQTMITRLKQSIAINPIDANSYLLMAKYYQLLEHSEKEANTEANIEANIEENKNTSPYNTLAEQAYINAIKHQPSWDYAWAELAQFYSNQQTLNEAKLKTALSNAMLLGPYENKSQLILIPLIFKHWPLIANNKKDQRQAIELINHAFKYANAQLILNSAKKHQKLTILAPLLTKQWHKNVAIKFLKETDNDK